MNLISFAKAWIMIFSIKILLIGIGIIFFTFFYINYNEIIPSKDYKNINIYIISFTIIFTVLLISLGILGLYFIKNV